MHAAVGTVNESNCITGDIRLKDGSHANEGRVEICVNRAWSTVCATSGWNLQAAQIVCKQLGDDFGKIYHSIIKN